MDERCTRCRRRGTLAVGNIQLVHEKVLDYLEARASLVWVVDPRARTVTVYRPDGSASLLRGDDRLLGEEVLPGFSVSLNEIFGD